MNKSIFENMTDNLKMSVSKEIAYTYSAFIPEGEKQVISLMKHNISLWDRKLLEKNLQNQSENKIIFPYDVLIPKIKKHIENFYDEFRINFKTTEKLNKYGKRADIFKNQFYENIEKSKENTINKILHEINVQMSQSKDVKSVILHIDKIIDKRIKDLNNLLYDSYLQLNNYMIIWDLQDKGYKKYRIKINGDTCETCKELDEKVFSISEAKSGENFPLIHPNCDCTVEILDDEKNVVHTIKNELKENESLNIFEYLQDSLEQVILGNWTSEVNLFGTLLQVISGFIGIDIIADVRDILYDLIKFNSSHQHILQTIFDIISVIPVVGGVKYIDEVSDVLNITSKYGDEAADALENIRKYKRIKLNSKEAKKAAKELGFEPTGRYTHGQPIFKKGNKYITPDVDSHNGGVWKMADSIDGLNSKKTRLGTYDKDLKRIGD